MSKYLAAFPLFFLLLSSNIECANELLPNFSELAEASSPAVVNISSSKTVSYSSRGFSPRGFNDPFDDDFFKFVIFEILQFSVENSLLNQS